MGHFADGAGRGRGNDEGVGPETEVNVGVPFAGVGRKELTDNGFAGQGGEGHGGDELLGRRGHDDLNLGAGLDEQAAEDGALVGGDSAGDSEDYVLAFQHFDFM